MKTKLLLLAIVTVAFIGSQYPCSAADSVTFSPGLTIPDNDLNGASDTETFNSYITSITNIQISLDISGGYDGDLYAYLRHGNTGFAVLLNGVGRTAGNLAGSAATGFNITLGSDAAGDIHNAPTGSGPLTGTWQADGRNIDPLLSLDTTARTALLDSFDGMSASGDWTLFFADTSPVGVATLQDWTLTVEGAVPEPSSISLGLLGACAAGIVRHRSRKTRLRFAQA